MPMFRSFGRPQRDGTIRALYGMIVAQARSPAFYRDYGTPDTVPGRIEMIVLHLALVFRRLRTQPAAKDGTGQHLFDLFCQDMDDNFREMGVGDRKMPKEMGRVAEAFYGRAKAYDAVLDSGDESALIAAVARNIYGRDEPLGARRLATYIQEAVRHLAEQDTADLEAGQLTFPEPQAVAPPPLQEKQP
jgi:cytochrome b pre-mRNA-processing protein 3